MSYEYLFSESRDFSSTFEAVQGYFREWAVRTERWFSKRFRAKDADELEALAQEYSGFRPHELHMSVQMFDFRGKEIGWTLVFDVDNGTEADLAKLKECFSGVLWVEDERHHLWFPDWETTVVQDKFGTEDLYYFKLGLERALRLRGQLDLSLWTYHRHLIRFPLSFHFSSGRFLNFKCGEREFLRIWLGVGVDMRSASRNFEELFNHFLQEGRCISAFESTEEPVVRKGGGETDWIQRLMRTPVEVGYRGLMLWRVIMRYLVSVKGMSRDEVVRRVHEWLDLSHGDRKRDRDLYSYPKQTYNYFKRRGLLPISLQTLKREYPAVWRCLSSSS